MLRPRTILALVGLLAIGGAFAYFQFQKLKDYCISVKKIKLNGITWQKADIDLFLNFVNKSSLALTIYTQEYLIYMNDVFVAKISNAAVQNILPNSTNVLSNKLEFNPQEALQKIRANITDLITRPETVTIKIGINIKVGIGILKFMVNTDYITNVKELMSSIDPNKKQKC